jgi:hypothetical protein
MCRTLIYQKQCRTSPGTLIKGLIINVLSNRLDKLAKADPEKVYSSIALSAILTHKVKLGSMHADTTSKMVYGKYEDCQEKSRAA